MNMFRSQQTPEQQTRNWILVLLLGIGLTMWFWLDLWLEGGLIAGDIYSYFMPQKLFYAESLKAGTIPLWNPLVGHGYSAIAESQTGIFYPPNLLLYRLLDVNTAYNVNHLLHYIFAFVMMVVFAREIGLSFSGGILAALVFVYGWFPPRCCWEWAIITGAYLPACLWILLRYQKTKKLGWLWGLSGCLTLQLLAGHFNLAFITQLALSIWAIASFATGMICNKTVTSPTTVSVTVNVTRKILFPGVAIALGILIASVQLLPTWALKQSSQRETSSSADFDPGYGHIPPEYLSQAFLPWRWYADSSTLDSRLGNMISVAGDSGTNAVEAHLYFGILPLILAIIGVFFFFEKVKKEKNATAEAASTDRQSLLILAGLGLFGVVYATGLLLPVLQHFPGFGFFRGPGRYGILTVLAVAIWAGFGMEQLLRTRKFSSVMKGMTVTLILMISVIDFSWVSSRVTYSFMVAETPIALREKSPLREMFANRFPPARIFAPGPNLVTTLGITATPVYLGIGPAEYFDPELIFPSEEDVAKENLTKEKTSPFRYSTSQIQWLQNAGVTHILSFKPPMIGDASVKLIWQGYDPFLNSAWGRKEPLYLSEVVNSRGRASWENKKNAVGKIRWKEYLAHQISLEVSTESEQELILTDLYDEDWIAILDGSPIPCKRAEGMYRSVSIPEGEHELRWEYRPSSVWLGKVISIATLTIWLFAGILLYCPKKGCN